MRIKDVVELKNIKTENHSKPYIGLENIESWNSRFIPTESVSEGINNEYDKGDILFGKLRPYLAKGYIAEGSGVCSTEFFVLHANKGFSNKYLLYRFLTPSFIGYINSKVADVKMPRTNWNDFSSTPIDIPSLEVQQRVVDYLDAETAKIDHAIELLRKKRDAYTRLKSSVINRAVTRGLNPNVKLKDSGVDWIGMIPEGWEVKRGKDLGVFSNGIMYTPNDLRDKGDGILVLRSSNIQNNEISLLDNVYVSPSVIPENKFVDKHDIIICSRNGSVSLIGKSTIIRSKMNATYGAFMIRMKTNQNPIYIQNILNTVIDKYRGLFATTTINQLTIKDLCGMFFCVPPLSEQHAIADYLDDRCTRIDKATTIVDKQIDAYTRLKKSLINEVVTGKRRV